MYCDKCQQGTTMNRRSLLKFILGAAAVTIFDPLKLLPRPADVSPVVAIDPAKPDEDRTLLYFRGAPVITSGALMPSEMFFLNAQGLIYTYRDGHFILETR